MKNLLATIFVLCWLLGCNYKKKYNPEFSVAAEIVQANLDSLNSLQIKSYVPSETMKQHVKIELKNESEKEESYAVMSCSYSQNFKISDSSLHFMGKNCDSNYPVRITIPSGDTKTYDFIVLKNRKDKIKEYSIGFKIIKIKPSLDLLNEYESQLESPKLKIIWSNKLSF
jgi:hypothetical protein